MIHGKLVSTSWYPVFCYCTRCCMSPATIIVTVTTIIKLDISAGVYNLQRAFTYIISLSLICYLPVCNPLVAPTARRKTPSLLTMAFKACVAMANSSRWPPLQPLHFIYHFMFQEHQTVRNSLHTYHPFSHLSCLVFAGPLAYMSFPIFPRLFLPIPAIPNFSFCVWLISISILSFRLINVVAYVRISYPCKDE